LFRIIVLENEATAAHPVAADFNVLINYAEESPALLAKLDQLNKLLPRPKAGPHS